MADQRKIQGDVTALRIDRSVGADKPSGSGGGESEGCQQQPRVAICTPADQSDRAHRRFPNPLGRILAGARGPLRARVLDRLAVPLPTQGATEFSRRFGRS